jgi:hypothetical protein
MKDEREKSMDQSRPLFLHKYNCFLSAIVANAWLLPTLDISNMKVLSMRQNSVRICHKIYIKLLKLFRYRIRWRPSVTTTTIIDPLDCWQQQLSGYFIRQQSHFIGIIITLYMVQ